MQYFEKNFGNPVKFPKRNYINFMIAKLLTKPPRDFIQKPFSDELRIELSFLAGKDIRSYYYLSKQAEATLRTSLRQEFYFALSEEIKTAVKNRKVTKKEAIYMFMEKYGIDETYFEALKKKDYRDRKQ
jgi:hypothetical protein